MRRRVLIVVPQLVAGGSEKVLTTIAAALDADRFDVHVAILGSIETISDARATYTTHVLGCSRARYAGWKLLRLIWSCRPQVIVSAGGQTAMVVAVVARLVPQGTRVILRLGTLPSKNIALRGWKRTLDAWGQRRVDVIVCQSRALAKDLSDQSRMRPDQLRIIANPVRRRERELWGKRNTELRFIYVGRLSPEKRVDLILRAFAIIRQKNATARLTLVGEGPSRNALERLAAREIANGSVLFAGFQNDPLRFMLEADAMVMASEYEGLPNAALEAISMGLPVLALACPGGIDEIAETTELVSIVHERTPEALADAMSNISNYEAAAPAAQFWNRFGFDQVLRQYEEMLSE